ncbi:MAG: hypothetical protein HZB55_03545 [Deltaproteobacteria bacterium]|nr:hypothetical protein [Deltaproteobacteria bacterium]
MLALDPNVQALEAALGRPIEVRWTDNRTVYLSVRPAKGVGWVLRLHRAFQGAPGRVWRSIQAFLRTGRRASLGPARAHFESWRAGAPPAGAVARRARLRPSGRAYDLEALAVPLLGLPHLGSLPPVGLSWGIRRSPGRRSVRLGSYRPLGPSGPALIRVHPVLDAAHVPAVAVASVLHHELVHHCLMTRAGPAEGLRHGREFRRLEALFPAREDALAWEREELPRLLARRGTLR